MPRWPTRLRPPLRRSRARGWVRPGNDITRAIEDGLRAPTLPPHLPSQPLPVPAPLAPEAARADDSGTGRPSSAA